MSTDMEDPPASARDRWCALAMYLASAAIIIGAVVWAVLL